MKKVEDLSREIESISNGNPTINAKLLLDSNVTDKDEFVLWIKWKKLFPLYQPIENPLSDFGL